MQLSISQLINQMNELILGISEKFHISLVGSEEFVKLAITEWVKTNYKIEISENFLIGPPEFLKRLELEILSWKTEDFDEEDFQVIGYCKNIR